MFANKHIDITYVLYNTYLRIFSYDNYKFLFRCFHVYKRAQQFFGDIFSENDIVAMLIHRSRHSVHDDCEQFSPTRILQTLPRRSG